MISDNYSKEIKCPAKIIWDRGYDKEGSYAVSLDLDLTLSDSKPETNIAQSVSVSENRPDHIEFLVEKLNRFELSNCKAGDDVNLWIAEGIREIFIFRQGSDFSEGKIGVCPDELFKTIQNATGVMPGLSAFMRGDAKYLADFISKAEMAERLKPLKAAEKKRRQDLRKDLTTPIRVFHYRFRYLLVFYIQQKWSM